MPMETCRKLDHITERHQRGFNHRPDTVFRHPRSDRGLGLVRPPLGVSKRSVVELIGKDQQIALAEYSRLMVLFSVLGQYLTQVKGQIFGNSMIFQLYESISAKLHIYRSSMEPSPACFTLNSAQNEVFWCISVDYLGRIVLIDDAVSHR